LLELVAAPVAATAVVVGVGVVVDKLSIRDKVTVILPPFGVNFRALVIRFLMT